VAILTDSAADLLPEEVAAGRIAVVPLSVSFSDAMYQPGVDLSVEEFWVRLTAPGAPFPKTAAPSSGLMQAAFERAFREGAEAVVCVMLSGGLSATVQSARIARTALPDREIHVVDTRWATIPQGMLVLLATEMAAEGRAAREIAAELERRIPDLHAFVAVDTLEYLRRGGRISTAKAALGMALSVHPIVTVVDGELEQVERVRTRGRARQRVIELMTALPAERLTVLHTQGPDVERFADELARATGFDRSRMAIRMVGATIGAHLGPGAVGAAALCHPS
jgi:DegV family protein with EDD domain